MPATGQQGQNAAPSGPSSVAAATIEPQQEDLSFSLETRLSNPLTGSAAPGGPPEVRTGADAMAWGQACMNITSLALEHLSPENYLYDTLSDVGLDAEALRDWHRGDNEPINANDGTQLRNVVFKVESALWELNENLVGDGFDVSWNYPDLGITYSASLSARKASNFFSFVDTAQSFMKRLEHAEEEQDGSPWLDRISSISEAFGWLRDDIEDFGSGFLDQTLHTSIRHAMSSAEGLFDDMAAASTRVVDLAFVEPFQSSGARTLTTYGDAASVFQDIRNDMNVRMEELSPAEGEDGAVVRGAFLDCTTTASALADIAVEDAETHGWDTKMSQATFDFVMDDIIVMQDDAARVQEALKEAAAKLRAAVATAKADNVRSHQVVADLQRRAFLMGDGSDLDAISAMLGHTLTMGDELDSLMAMSSGYGIFGSKNPIALRLPTLMSNGYALFSLYSSWATSSPLTKGTPLEGLNALNNLVGVWSTWNGYAINPTYLLTAYIGPALQAATILMGQLQMALIENNDGWVALGYDPLRLQIEPGGEPMWQYMTRVMNSSGPVEIRDATVYDYFDDFSEQFARIDSEEDELKDDGGYIFGIGASVDPKQLPSWVHRNRTQVWASLYGSRVVPGQR